MENEKDKELPAGWVSDFLENLIQPRGEKALPSDYPHLKFVGMDHVESKTTKIIGFTAASEMKSSAARFYTGDVLYGRLRPYLNKVTKVHFDGLASAEFIVFPDSKVLNNSYLKHRLNAADFVRFAAHLNEGDRPRVSFEQIGKLVILLPPLAEQHRIVAKLEELFSELDKGVENLRTAQQQLKVYRQAVLQWAFEGKLTAEWRKEQPDLPSGQELLKHVKAERLINLKERGIKQKDIVPLSEEEINDLVILPKGWVWIKLGDIAWSLKDGPHYSPRYEETGIPFISGGNVRPDGVDFNNVKYISPELHKELSKRCLPELGDILYTKGGTTGIARVNTYGSDFNVWVHVAVIKLIDGLLPFYIQHCLNSSHCYKQSQKFTHGVGNQDLGLTRMVHISLPLCSLHEQQQIVAEIESRLSVCDKLEETIEQSLLQAEALRQSILKQAFAGKLVPQDPSDEPAEKLLARIRAERAATTPVKKPSKGRTAK